MVDDEKTEIEKAHLDRAAAKRTEHGTRLGSESETHPARFFIAMATILVLAFAWMTIIGVIATNA